MSVPKVVTIDYETKGILPRPKYPPKPVSLAVKWPGDSTYKLMAWGHCGGCPEGKNNCTEKEARAELRRAYDSKYGLLTQYGAFDHDVAETHWDLPLPPWERMYDTLYAIFLENPHAPALGLKESAERLLGVPPEEQDRMKAWILDNVPEAKRRSSEWGAYICECPYDVVKPYHKGDLTRTLRIFEHLHPMIVATGMSEAYDRERRLMPVLLRNARRGMRVDVPGLERDTPKCRAGVAAVDGWLRKRLGDINLDSPIQLGDALHRTGAVREFKLTAKGQRSTSKKHLTIDVFKDARVYQALTYRAQMETAVGTFMEAWLELAGDGDTIYPNWAQVRSAKGDSKDTKGARSGRIICSKPNLLNIPKVWKKAIVAGYVHPSFVKGLPELPYIRTYALPHKGKRWGRRDFDQQELRLFAHFEEGPVMEGFLADPLVRSCVKCGAIPSQQCAGGATHDERLYDIHEIVRAEEERALVEAALRDSIDRDTAKNTVFARLYGQGVTGLMETLKLPDDERVVAQVVQKAINAAIPSIKELDNQLKELVNAGRPIKTWGGRLYYKEPNKYVEKFGRDMDFAYKMLNYLVQGSGADVTKETICRYYEHPKRTEEMIVTVYDEIDIDLPLSDAGARREMSLLRDVMLSIETDVPMKSKGEVGPNWGTMTKFAI